MKEVKEMYKKKIGFGTRCSSCSACCCRNIPELLATEHGLELIEGTNICTKLDQTTNLCTIYNNRPFICNVDEWWNVNKPTETREEWYEENEKACETLRNNCNDQTEKDRQIEI